VSVLVSVRSHVKELFSGFVTLLSVLLKGLSVIMSLSVVKVAVVVAARIVSRWWLACRTLWSVRRNVCCVRMVDVLVNVRVITVVAVGLVIVLPHNVIWLIVLSVLFVKRWVLTLSVIRMRTIGIVNVMTGFVPRRKILPS